jgi:hypothetical protein
MYISIKTGFQFVNKNSDKSKSFNKSTLPQNYIDNGEPNTQPGGSNGVARFSSHIVPKQGKIYLIAPNLPNGHTIYQMAVLYLKWLHNIPTFSIPRPSKIYPHWDFWFENIPSP